LEKVKLGLILTLIGGLMFVITLPSLIGLIVNGPVYDIVQKETFETNKTKIVQFSYLVTQEVDKRNITILPIGTNFNVTFSISGNGTFEYSLVDKNGKIISSSGQQARNYYSFRIDQINSQTILTLEIRKSSNLPLVVTLNVDGEYKISKVEPIRYINLFYSYVMPIFSIVGLISLIYGFYTIRKESRGETEKELKPIL